MAKVRGPRILIIDDYQELREAVAELLSFEGYTVEQAGDGAEALQKLRSGFRSALILMDIVMPGMNGVEFRRQQSISPEFADIPVVTYSGFCGFSDLSEQIGAAAFVNKSADVNQLISVVRQYCKLR